MPVKGSNIKNVSLAQGLCGEEGVLAARFPVGDYLIPCLGREMLCCISSRNNSV